MIRISFLAVLAVVMALPALPALARDNYGAIAISPSTGALGWSYDFTSRRLAERKALANCAAYAGDCRVAAWFRNACGAVATGDGNGWGGFYGSTPREARANAIKVCSRFTKRCTVKRWVCTTR